ncbi:MAG: DUF296 domain-containing protein [Capsulimonadales bacterium]|nr:DUF296 domain-containing protein [Capsulimonadales bacterium]
MRLVMLRLPAGENPLPSLRTRLAGEGIEAGFCLSVTGEMVGVHLRIGEGRLRRIEGEVRLLALNGPLTGAADEPIVTVCDRDGAVYAGVLADGATLRSEAELQILVTRSRETPPENGAIAVRERTADTPAEAGYVLQTDGASKGNPGPAGIGFVLFRAGDPENPIVARGEPIEETTNNVAEYRALIRGLQEALLRGVARLEVRTDSQLMARQVSGGYRVTAPTILPLHAEAKKLLARFETATVTYVPREQNALADKLANQGVAAGRK